MFYISSSSTLQLSRHVPRTFLLRSLRMPKSKNLRIAEDKQDIALSHAYDHSASRSATPWTSNFPRNIAIYIYHWKPISSQHNNGRRLDASIPSIIKIVRAKTSYTLLYNKVVTWLSWGKVRYFILKFFLEMFSKVFPWEFEVGMQMTTWLININQLKDYWDALDVNNIQ